MTTVLVFGTFDVIHPGHLWFLRQARSCGDRLIVSVARDSYVRRFKKRDPVRNERQRVDDVLATDPVDEAHLSDEEEGTYSAITRFHPDVICFGYDQHLLAENLRRWLEERGLDIELRRVEPYKPDRYKSSILNRSGNRSEADVPFDREAVGPLNHEHDPEESR